MQTTSGAQQPAGTPAASGAKFKVKVRASPGTALAGPAQPSVPPLEAPGQPMSVHVKPEIEVDTSLLDDNSEEDVKPLPSSGRKGRAAVLDDSDEDKIQMQPKRPRLSPEVSEHMQSQPKLQQAALSKQPSSRSKQADAAGARRSGRQRRATGRAMGAEGQDSEHEDLGAMQEMAVDDDDYEFLDAGAMEGDEEDSDLEAGVGSSRRRRTGRAGAGATGGRRTKTEVTVNEHGELVPAAYGQTDFSHLTLKQDHTSRPLWATPDGHIFLETFSPVYKQAQDFLVAIAEPVCRPEFVHEYQLTPHSLYAAVSVGLDTDTIISVLGRLSKVQLDDGLKDFISAATRNYGKVKLVLKRNHFMVETSDPHVFNVLWNDPTVASARVSDEVFEEKALKERAVVGITRVDQSDLTAPSAPPPFPAAASARTGNLHRGSTSRPGGAASILPAAQAATQGAVAARGFFGSAPGQDTEGQGGEDHVGEGGKLSIDDVEEGVDEGKVVKSFEIKGDMVEVVKKRCMPGTNSLNYPMLEEYDFRGDRTTPDLNAELRPHVKLRPYQEKSLSKMFGNGRARSGIIVLPCGAGKSLVGVAAAARMRKSCLCLCTSSVSVDQWKHQFMLWTNLQDHQIARFTSDNKEQFAGSAGIMITTFTMVAFSGKRSEESEKVMEAIRSREWGLLLMDEVHVVPAQMFRKVVGIIHSHCKLGLTATLVREDERIGDLNFLIGPKLYEANWLDLTRAGHIANVQCVEVWCPMTREFYREYLKPENSNKKQLLYAMNPNKFMACQFLIHWHEKERGDKVIVFSDNIWALKDYAKRMGKPFIYGPTSHAERTRVLHAFKNDPNVNTIFLSKVGDNSLDIPEANVLIQISSHAGSRRQEAQRLGRILRAKRAKSGPVSASEYNAFFYTLVSQDTQEMYYSTKRQQFLVDQGYSFKVVTNLVETAQQAMSGQLTYCRREEQMDLLCRVLAEGLDERDMEVGQRDKDEEELAQAFGRAGGVRRNVGDVRALTGAIGLRYQEYRAEAGPAEAFAAARLPAPGTGRGAAANKPSDKAKYMHKRLHGKKT